MTAGRFVGLQAQADRPSVQGVLIDGGRGASAARRLAVHAAGRTDTGVHALGQVAHFDLAKDWDADMVRDALNSHLRPQPIAMLAAEHVADDFHARFSARKRHYLYRILNRARRRRSSAAGSGRCRVRSTPTPCTPPRKRLIGQHDFTTFRVDRCQAKSPVKTLDRLDVGREGEEVRVAAAARSFLHHQVRSMVGSLVHGRRSATGPPDDLAAALEARDRAACGPVAPPDGLYLVRVDY